MDSCGVTRRVASARKRNGDQRGKTPKKRKPNELVVEKKIDGCLESKSDPVKTEQTWIQNSFMTDNFKSNTCTLPKSDKSLKKSEYNNMKQLNTHTSTCGNLGNSPSSSWRKGISTCVTSTPKHRLEDVFVTKLPPASSEPYSSQHDSFNDSDSLFAEIDFVSLEEKHRAPIHPCATGKHSSSHLPKRTTETSTLSKQAGGHPPNTYHNSHLLPTSCTAGGRFTAQEVVTVTRSAPTNQHSTTMEMSGFENDSDLITMVDLAEKCAKNTEIKSDAILQSKRQNSVCSVEKYDTVHSSSVKAQAISSVGLVHANHGRMTSADPFMVLSDEPRVCSGTTHLKAGLINRKSIVNHSKLHHKQNPTRPHSLIGEPKTDSSKEHPVGGTSSPARIPHATVTMGETPVSSKDSKTFSTPGSGHSIRDKIKKALARNAKAVTPLNSRIQQLRAESLVKAAQEAEKLQEQGTKFDIGPFYGLPSKVQELLETQRGINKLYEWQEECLSLPALREGTNLIYSLPTSGGKTLVAEVLILRELLCKKKDALLILPFVAIVQEKVKTLSPFAVELDFLVEEYAASKGAFPPRKRRSRPSLYIATIEKAHSLVNSLIDMDRLDSIGLVVVDELHMLGEGGSRGASLEMTLTKIMHVSKTTQLVGMSATLNNIEDLSAFLHAHVYSNDFRPVELKEYVKMEDNVYEIDSRALCPDDRLKHSRVLTFKNVQYGRELIKQDPDHLVGLVLEVVPSYSCLVFCPTKKNCENVGELLCRQFPRELADIKKDERKMLLKALWHDGNGQLCPVLRRTIPFGVAYHHSGLTGDERKLIEEAYTEGVLCLLACTSTLAAGVNLPAKRVILRSPYVGASFLSRSQYKQMIGRAGRAGIDSSGESILVLQRKDKNKLLDLVSGPYDSCRSSLSYDDRKGLRSLLLTTIGLKVTPATASVVDFLQRTLHNIQSKDSDETVAELSRTALQQLLDRKLITQKRSSVGDLTLETPSLEVTNLGRAVFKGSVDVDLGDQLYNDLSEAQKSLVVSHHLHLLYLVTPYEMASQVSPRWMTYLDEIGSLDDAGLKVTCLVGVSESYIMKKASGQRVKKALSDQVVARMYLALVLYRLWRQETVWAVAERFQLPRGFIQNLLTGAASFASCVLHFCQELEEFWAYQKLLGDFVKRLSYCVSMELIPLMEIAGVKQGRARQLYHAGFKSMQQVAHANPEDLVRQIENLSRRAARQIVASAQLLIQEKAETLLEEADEMVTMPTDMPNVALSEIKPKRDSQDSLGVVSSQGKN